MVRDKICLPEIPVFSCHGVYAEERKLPQQFVVSLTLWLDLQPAALSDQVADTVDYGALFCRVKHFAESTQFCLIESLAAGIAALVLEEKKVEQVSVTVEKCRAKADDFRFPARVELTRTSHE